MNRFTHLHVHTEYSLLDGSAKIKELVKRAKELEMDKLAITDHGVMFGVIDFYKAALENGIKPIIGCEVYVSKGSRLIKEGKEGGYYHLVLLCENNTGYQNLIKLVSKGFTEGFYYKPRIDLDMLREHHEGLIALSACLSGAVAKNILTVSYDRALEQALEYDSIFGRGNFFLEIQDHGIDDQRTVNSMILKMSDETGIPMVATNDSHYIKRPDSKAHDVLLCIQTGKTVDDEDRMRYPGDQFYLKSPDEMYSLFPYARKALENTELIGDRCNVTITFNEYKLPKFKTPDNIDAYEYLKSLCYNGLAERYGDRAELFRDKLEYELNMINQMGFVDYFLIVWDFINFARKNGIYVGVRGSAAGSVVIYSLRITNIDPVRFNLYFERFLNPERVTMPDIDIDICYERRQQVIDYVVNKYQADHVAQIITFGTMGAKAVIRDVGRALGMPYADVDRIAKMVPFGVGITIEKAIELNLELQKAYEEEDDTKNLIDMARMLEGLPRHASTHAAGVLVCDKPVNEYVPLYQNDNVITTQYPMTTLEELGLLKNDFLGLRTLTVMQKAVQEIKRKGVEINLDELDFDDPKIYEMISQGRTEGVFQLESSGMKSFMKELKPNCIDDILAGIALYRPGPMSFIPKYVKAKNQNATIEYTHESLAPILADTYGCIVYQEHVMQICRELAGYSLGRADLVRRAMSKKKQSVMEQEQNVFINGSDTVRGCVNSGIPRAVAERIFDEMSDFAKYAFPKGHAASYAIIVYQTAWLKYHYPVEYMAAILSSVMDFTEKVAEYIDECRKMNIQLYPPDINKSYETFTVEGSGIRFGMLAIKNVGRQVIEAIVNERDENGEYKSLTDLIKRIESRDINKRGIESFIKAGALDSLGGKRRQYMMIYKDILTGITQTKKKNIEGQMNLFDMAFGGLAADSAFDMTKDSLPDVEEYPKREFLANEKEVLGIYLSGHPLSEYEAILSKHINSTSLEFINRSYDGESSEDDSVVKAFDGKQVSIGGIIVDKTVKYTKSNKAMAFITIEDLYGSVEVIVFPQTYERYMGRLNADQIIVVQGVASVKEDEDAKVICNEIKFYEEIQNFSLWLKIPKSFADVNGSRLKIKKIISSHKGRTPVIIYYEGLKQTEAVNEAYWVDPSDAMMKELKEYLGEKAVILK